MLLTISQFKERVYGRMDALVDELQELTGRTTPEEEQAWRRSLPLVARVFDDPSLDPLHLYFGSEGNLGIEYQLPASSSWCDIVLLGQREGKASAIMLELKDWETAGDSPGSVEALMLHHGNIVLHPSDQVRGYTEYCRRFHSAVQDFDASVHGCVVFTRDRYINVYRQAPNEALAAQYPCFSATRASTDPDLPEYFRSRISQPAPSFAEAFEAGTYRQDRGFIRHIGQQIMDPAKSPFELLDNQRRAFALTRFRVEQALFGQGGAPEKRVLIVDGPPGSGKSVVAAKIWATLVLDERLVDGNVVFTTTSASQRSNWEHLFQQVGGHHAAAGVVKTANSYSPISTHRIGQLRKIHGAKLFQGPDAWRDHFQLLRDLGEPFKAGTRDNDYLVSVVDEAHALINPEYPDGNGQFGFATALGPQAYHIMRTSVVSIFFLDAEQSFRDRENTTVADIRRWAAELGAEVHEDVSLRGSQFRCAGSTEYVEWLERLLRGDPPEELRRLARVWRRHLDLQMFRSLAEMERALRNRIAEGRSARLLASYARKWKTRDAANPHALPPQMQDFNEPDGAGSWSRPWNYVPRGTDYTAFVQAAPGSRMAEDALSEVGCAYAVRGFDFDYTGFLWLGDLLWRGDRWVIDQAHVFESGLINQLRRAKAETMPYGRENTALRAAVARAYRILMSRHMRGIYLWFEDDETRRHVEACLG